MNPKTIGVAAVALLAVGVVAYRTTSRDIALADPAPPGVQAGTTAATSLVLVADPDEAESSCLCGQIIRSVRDVRNKGVLVREVDPEKTPDVAKNYKALVNPTVLVLDETGKEVRRFEGEDKATFAAIRSELDRMTKKP